MSEMDVKIVSLEPLRVASFWGFGPSPELEAWEKLRAWAEPRDLLDDLEANRVFGFNNPDPSAGSPNYGYELLIEVDEDTIPEGDMRLQKLDGGLYAVARCEVPQGGIDQIGKVWKGLLAWRESSKYKAGSHQWLEKSVAFDSPGIEFALDLYMPIAE